MWVLEHPAAVFLLIAVPPAIYARHFWHRRGGKLHFPFGIWNGVAYTPPATAQSALLALSALAFWVGVIASIVALAGPQRVTRERSYLTRGVDIVIALDQSPSMAARDFQPVNRFEVAREVIRGFVGRRENDPVGLVGFGAEASLRVPPTLDYSHLFEVLDSMMLLEMGDGTAIGMGLAVSALHLQRSSAPRRVIVLLTDGVNNAGEISPETAARAIASLGIELYVIGIGGTDEVEIELTDPATGRLLRGTIREAFDEQSLRQIAALGGGRYFFAGSRGALDTVFRTIESVEQVETRSLLRVRREPYDRLLVFLALGCIVFDFLVRRLVAREVFP